VSGTEAGPELVPTSEALWAGRVAIYEQPTGGAVIVLLRDGSGERSQHEIPPMMVHMFARMQKMSLRNLTAMIRGGTDDD
jgi:hypothetical protein